MTDVAAPLIATADPVLRDQAHRWCAALGSTPELAHDLTGVRRAWRHASAVIMGEDLLTASASAALRRRHHVVVISAEPAACWTSAIGLGAEAVCRPDEERRILELLAVALDGRDEACVVSVFGASGGAGASMLTTALAINAGRRGLRPLAVDADPGGGGLELLLGAERAAGLRWHDFAETRGRVAAGSLVEVLPQHRGVSTLSWSQDQRGPLPESWSEVFSAAVRGFDLLAVDVPRRFDEHTAELLGRSVLTLLIVPEDICAVAAARHAVVGIRHNSPAVGLISVARPGGIGPEPAADVLGVPVLARLRQDRRLRGAIDRGHGPGQSRTFTRASKTVLDALGLEAS